MRHYGTKLTERQRMRRRNRENRERERAEGQKYPCLRNKNVKNKKKNVIPSADGNIQNMKR